MLARSLFCSSRVMVRRNPRCSGIWRNECPCLDKHDRSILENWKPRYLECHTSQLHGPSPRGRRAQKRITSHYSIRNAFPFHCLTHARPFVTRRCCHFHGRSGPVATRQRLSTSLTEVVVYYTSCLVTVPSHRTDENYMTCLDNAIILDQQS